MTLKLRSLLSRDRPSTKSAAERPGKKVRPEHLHRKMRSSSLHRQERQQKKRPKLSSNLEATSPKPSSFSNRRTPPEPFRPLIRATLCLILKDNKILLLKKSKGLLGQGKWNAPGGKILPNEEPKACAVREVFEETRLIAKNPEEVGLLYFYNNSKRMSLVWTVHVFLTHEFEGVPINGRQEVINSVAETIRSTPGVTLLDVESNPDHNRSVISFVGEPGPVKQAALAASAKAFELLDLNKHEGEHPRMGAVDVVPFVPLSE